jgi:ATP-dependent helicase/nuclease subunit B
VDQQVGPADRGNLVHQILDRFLAQHLDGLPEDAERRLMELAAEMMTAESAKHPSAWAFWGPRLERIARWFIATEQSRRPLARTLATEVGGTLRIETPGGPFTLTATADRIDRLGDGRLAIIDYKTGMAPGAKEVGAGLAPQLALEAAIAAAGGFAGLPPAPAGELAYWRVTGGRKAGEIIAIAEGDKANTMAEEAARGLASLIALFDDPATPYESMPWPARAQKFSDYRHLARIAEWAEGADPQ